MHSSKSGTAKPPVARQKPSSGIPKPEKKQNEPTEGYEMLRENVKNILRELKIVSKGEEDSAIDKFISEQRTGKNGDLYSDEEEEEEMKAVLNLRRPEMEVRDLQVPSYLTKTRSASNGIKKNEKGRGIEPKENLNFKRPLNEIEEDLNSEESSKFQSARPQTALSYKPIYTKSLRESQIQAKKYDYGKKNFATIPKKTDRVARINQLKNEWNKNKFLKNSSQTSKQGRKLNLADRNEAAKPDEIFHRYVKKTTLYEYM